MSHIRIGTTQFYYELTGKGAPLILIAGYGCDHTFWGPLRPYLEKKFRVLVFDNRAVGQTLDDQEPFLVRNLADDVMKLCDALDLYRPHIVGHSMGGSVAQSLGIRYSHRIGKLVIMASTSKWRQATLCALEVQIRLREARLGSDLLVDAMIPWVFGEEFLKSHFRVRELRKFLLKNPYPPSVDNLRRQQRALEKFNATSKIGGIAAPCLVCYGREDLLVLPDEARQLASQIPGAKLHEFESSAHSIVAEETKSVAEILLKFL